MAKYSRPTTPSEQNIFKIMRFYLIKKSVCREGHCADLRPDVENLSPTRIIGIE